MENIDDNGFFLFVEYVFLNDFNFGVVGIGYFYENKSGWENCIG